MIYTIIDEISDYNPDVTESFINDRIVIKNLTKENEMSHKFFSVAKEFFKSKELNPNTIWQMSFDVLEPDQDWHDIKIDEEPINLFQDGYIYRIKPAGLLHAELRKKLEEDKARSCEGLKASLKVLERQLKDKDSIIATLQGLLGKKVSIARVDVGFEDKTAAVKAARPNNITSVIEEIIDRDSRQFFDRISNARVHNDQEKVIELLSALAQSLKAKRES